VDIYLKFEGSHTPDEPFCFYGGDEVRALEEEWNSYYGSKYAISMNSATSGLYASIGALGIGFGDEVIVSPIHHECLLLGSFQWV